MSVKTEYFTEGKNKYTKIQYNNEERIFKVYSARAGNCLCLLSETFPEGITTKNMRDRYGIDDNKLFGELLDQSGFRDYMEHIGTRDRLKVWKINLDTLFNNTKNFENPIWFGIHEQTNLSKFYNTVKEKQGLICNITKTVLLEDVKSKFLSNFRKVAIDHRRPQLKQGTDTIDNLQFLSYYVNERKNQVCAKCNDAICEKCALAYPENNYIVYPTNENIKDVLKQH